MLGEGDVVQNIKCKKAGMGVIEKIVLHKDRIYYRVRFNVWNTLSHFSILLNENELEKVIP